MERVFIDPDKVEELAEQIKKLTGDMNAKMDEVDLKVKSLKEVWVDPKMDNYQDDFRKVVTSFKSVAELIPQLSRELSDVADKIRVAGKSV